MFPDFFYFFVDWNYIIAKLGFGYFGGSSSLMILYSPSTKFLFWLSGFLEKYGNDFDTKKIMDNPMMIISSIHPNNGMKSGKKSKGEIR